MRAVLQDGGGMRLPHPGSMARVVFILFSGRKKFFGSKKKLYGSKKKLYGNKKKLYGSKKFPLQKVSNRIALRIIIP